MSDTLEIFGQEWTGVTGIKATDDNDLIKTYIRPQGNLAITANSASVDVSQYATASVAVPETNFIVTLSWNTSQQKWLPDCTMADLWGAYQAGKKIALRPTDADLDDMVTIDGFWSDDEIYVYFVWSYHQPATGVQGAEFRAYVWTNSGITLDTDQVYRQPTGTINISQSGNTDVTNYATANVPAGALDDILEFGVQNNITITVSNSGLITASVERSTSADPVITSGYINSSSSMPVYIDGSKTQQLTTKAAATITPGTTNQTIASGTYLTGAQTISGDANLVAGNIKSGTTIFGVTGNYEGGGGTSKNAQAVTSTTRVTSTSLTACSGTITVAKTGTYDVYWSTHRTSTSGSWSSCLYVNNTASGTEQTSGWSNHVQPIHLTGVSLTAGQTIRVYAKSRGSNYYAYVPLLTIIES